MNAFQLFALVVLMGCAAPLVTEPAGVEDDVAIAHDWDRDETGGCPDSWVLTYGIQGRVDITDTPLNIGNADALVGGLEEDEIVLRVMDDGGVPAEGQVLIAAFDLLQEFRVSVDMFGEIAIVTDLLSTAADECGVASGQLAGSTITWDECGFGTDHGTNSWNPDDAAYGPGCIRDYHVAGVVECEDNAWLASCEDGWLDEGVNELDYIYNQPMLRFDFDSADLESFTMVGGDYGTELPTYTNNRTWLMLEGVLKRMTLEPTPDCLCGE